MKDTTKPTLSNPLSALIDLPEQEKASRGLVYTPREIWQQPETWLNTFARLQARQAEIHDFLATSLALAPTVYLIGAGTSDYVGRALTSILRQQWRCDVIAIPSTELVTNIESYVVPGKPYLWISFSRSGDSSEGVAVLEMALQRYPEVQHIVVACNHDGNMPQLCDGKPNALVLVLDDAVNDRGLAMTSSFTNMVVAGHILANIRQLDNYKTILEVLSHAGSRVLQKADIAATASREGCRKYCFVGSGALAAAATECALKSLELTAGSVFTMSESTMGLRHGPMSALDSDTLVVSLLSSHGRRRKYEMDLLEEIHSKGLGKVKIVIAPTVSKPLQSLCDFWIDLELAGDFPDDYRVPVDAIFGQMLGLFSSIETGLLPDHPSPSGAINRVVSHVNIYR